MNEDGTGSQPEGLVAECRLSGPGSERLLSEKPWRAAGWELLDVRPSGGEGLRGWLALHCPSPSLLWDSALEGLMTRMDAWEATHPSPIVSAWHVVPWERFREERLAGAIPLSSGWRVIPSGVACEDDEANAGGVRSVRLAIGWAFGSGCHPTTRGCVRALEHLEREGLVRGRRVLDMGTGTGILALVAARMGARRVVALDVDPEALRTAQINVKSSGLDDYVEVTGLPPVAFRDYRADLVLANLTPSVFLRTFSDVLLTMKPECWLVASGFRVSAASHTEIRIRAAGFEILEGFEVDGWGVALCYRRGADL